MGGSSDQVIGYRYFTNFLLFIGNPIEKLLGINFDKRGWIDPFTDEDENILDPGVINSPSLYGETEGGVAGTVHVQYGRDDQEVLLFYKAYMDSKELPASAFPYQSYLAFKDFYVGNSGYMKEMLLWPKRTRIRNDGRRQWYEVRGDGAVVCEIGAYNPQPIKDATSTENTKLSITSTYTPYTSTSVLQPTTQILSDIDVNGFGESVTHNLNSWKVGAPGFLGAVVNNNEKNVWHNTTFIWGMGGTVILTYRFSVGSMETHVSFHTTGDILSMSIDESSGVVKEYTYIIQKTGVSSINLGLSLTMTAPAATSGNERSLYYTDAKSYYLKANGGGPGEISALDINPVHKIREILTDDTAMSKPESSVNDVNFMKAADRIYDEGLGVSWSITEKSCIDAINELCYHIESGIRVNRQTGLYEMVLFRDDWFEESEIHTISESKIKSMLYEITNADEVINQVNVNYYDRDNIKNSSFSISESGLIQTLGRVNAETLDFPYFMNMRNAEIVANWKLKQLSTGAFKGSFTTGWREARKWNRYDLIRLPWSRRWTGNILVRIMSINLGGPTNNEVSIEFIEVVPATGMINTTIVIDDPVDNKPQPPQPCNAKVFELPYFEAVQALGEREVNIELSDNPEVGYLCAIAEKPQNNSLNAALHVDIADGFERAATINYCETAYLDQDIDRMSSAFVVKNVGNIESVRIGSQIFINDEIMVYQSYDAETKVLTVKRGAFGIPQNHSIDSILYFADDFIAVDQTFYVHGEIISAKALTTTPSGVLDLDDAINYEVEFKARAIRPYPPANVKFNNVYFPETQIVTSNIILTWAHRNRVQQTGGVILGWYEDDVTIEVGVTYSYELISENVVLSSASNIILNTVTINASALIPNKAHTLKLWSVRDGYESYQKFEHSFFVEAVSLILTATATSNGVSGNTVEDANITVIVDELLKANVKFDGASITGKTMPGATVTIEVDD